MIGYLIFAVVAFALLGVWTWRKKMRLASVLSFFIAAAFVFKIYAVLGAPVVAPKSAEVVAMEQELVHVQPGDLLETKESALILVYRAHSEHGIFWCYRPMKEGGVDPSHFCLAHSLASNIKRIIRSDDQEYEAEMMRFMKQMLLPPPS
jgi:hypothetical protein